MLGQIESYDKDLQTGVIKVDDKFFEFYIDSWTSETPPKVGDDVDFLEKEGEVSEVGVKGEFVMDERPVKRRWIAGTLGIVFGLLGFHRFYLGFYTIGIMQILFTLATQGYGLMWGFIEAVLIFSGHIRKDAKGRFLK
ncbi:MAG: TM2 domain-containing protein [Methylococcales bacterium]|nr:TM2 domain-containing protein [Methylococcales bacterium]MCK5925268.1 TM2 domain-containing protein [Methylococcales bacterium]